MPQFELPLIDSLHVGGDLLASYLNSWVQAINSTNSGSGRPSYGFQGMLWVDNSASPILRIKIMTAVGASAADAVLFEVDTNNNRAYVRLTEGGTGASSAETARTALGLGDLALLNAITGAQVATGTIGLSALVPGTPGKLVGFGPSGAVEVEPSNSIELPRRVLALAPGGWFSTFYLMADGTVRACGRGDVLQNGDIQGGQIPRPMRIVFDEVPVSPIVKIRINGGSCFAITSGGVCYAWGYNQFGQLGLGHTTNKAIATAISFFRDNGISISDVVRCRAGAISPQSTLFLTSTQRLYGSGRNIDGELGDSSQTQRTTPVRCGTLEGIASVSMSSYPHHVLALTQADDLFGWGDNSTGALGLGNTNDTLAPTAITLMTNVGKLLAVGGTDGAGGTPRGHSFAIKNDGTLWTTGNTSWGQIGIGVISDTPQTAWTQVTTLALPVLDIDSSEGHGPTSVALVQGLSGGEAWVWGYGGTGALGSGSTSNNGTPAKPTSLSSLQGTFTKVAAGGGVNSSGIIVQSANNLYAAGYNALGNLGVGHFTNPCTTFKRVLGISGTISEWIAHGHSNMFGISVLLDDGRVDICGPNASYAQAGVRETQLRDLPYMQSVAF